MFYYFVLTSGYEKGSSSIVSIKEIHLFAFFAQEMMMLLYVAGLVNRTSCRLQGEEGNMIEKHPSQALAVRSLQEHTYELPREPKFSTVTNQQS